MKHEYIRPRVDKPGEAFKVDAEQGGSAAKTDFNSAMSNYLADITPEDRAKVYPVDRSVKRKLTERENELESLLRKKGVKCA